MPPITIAPQQPSPPFPILLPQACAAECAKVDGSTNYKFCRDGSPNTCTEHYTRGGPDLKKGECRCGSGTVKPADNDGSYGGIVLGIDCAGGSAPAPPPPAPATVQYSPTVFKNLAGDRIKTVYGANLGTCMEACAADVACKGFNVCSKQNGCAGGAENGQCDLKRWDGEPTYYEDQTATSGDGYMSQYVTARPPQPR